MHQLPSAGLPKASMMCTEDLLVLHSSSRLGKQIQNTQEVIENLTMLFHNSTHDSFHGLPHLSLRFCIYSRYELPNHCMAFLLWPEISFFFQFLNTVSCSTQKHDKATVKPQDLCICWNRNPKTAKEVSQNQALPSQWGFYKNDISYEISDTNLGNDGNKFSICIFKNKYLRGAV